jgi:HlyD family secretion protein
VPNAALRFTPPMKEQEPPSDGGSLVSKLLPGRPRSWSKQRKDATADNKHQRIWTLRDGQLIAMTVTTGATDGSMTEVTSGDVEPGMELVVDTLRAGR